jgi:GAF domain-containing protein
VRQVSEQRLGRLHRIIDSVGAVNGPDPARDLCLACVELLMVSGASLMVMTEGIPSVLSSSDPLADRLEDLHLVTGEGPSLDAHETGRPVSEPNLLHPRRERWIAFGPAALEIGAEAIFSFPLRIGGVRLGALTVHQTTAGDLSDDQHIDAMGIASVATTAILAIQAESSTGGLSPILETLAANNAAVHQASGMVSVQLSVELGEALVRIRAHAYSENRLMIDVSDDIVARRLRLHV